MSYSAAVITVSDKGSKGERQDVSGLTIEKYLTEAGYDVMTKVMVPDEQGQIRQALNDCIEGNINLILTTGGTGFSPRDVTPEATLSVIEKQANGIAEAIRAYSLTITPRAMLSRAVAGISKQSLIINLPGSPKACEEILSYILPVLQHGLNVLLSGSQECARQ